VAELLQSILKTASNLMDSTQLIGWDDLNESKKANAITSLMIAVEENALLLAETINNEKNLAEATNNILASIRIMRARGVFDQFFPTIESEEDSTMLVPSNALLETSVNGAVRIVFFLYDNLEAILTSAEVNSKIMGVVASKGRYEAISGPRSVEFTLRHLVSTRKESVCASWDYVQKAWSTADCEVIKTNQTHTSCKCQRLANYAILNVDQATINEAIKEEKMALPASEDGNLAVIVSITAPVYWETGPADFTFKIDS